jgi:hypothetical protein
MEDVQRLAHLLPFELQKTVAIVKNSRINLPIIYTEQNRKNTYTIYIDLTLWQQLKPPEQNLLFWHEVARIQSNTVPQLPWELGLVGTGLFFSLIEIISQNLVSLSVCIFMAGIGAYQLYQRNRGERSLREATAADQGAINLALQQGYSLSEAYDYLQKALKFLGQQAKSRSLKKRYQVRLSVLEITTEKLVRSLLS